MKAEFTEPATVVPNPPPPPPVCTKDVINVPVVPLNRNAAPAPGPALPSFGAPTRTFVPTEATDEAKPVNDGWGFNAVAPNAPVVPSTT